MTARFEVARAKRLAVQSRSRQKLMLRPTSGSGRKMEGEEVIRQCTIYGMPGFVLHASVGSLAKAELLTVSHVETGSALAHGTTPFTTLRAVRDKIRREASDRGVTCREALVIRISMMEQRLERLRVA